ncbi:MAG: hypothetical protein ACJ8DS_14985 [Microvirga sp.]
MQPKLATSRPGFIMTVALGSRGHLGHREGVIRDAFIVVYGLLMPVLDAILEVDANGRRMVIPHEPAPQSVARLSEKPEKATAPGVVKSDLQPEPKSAQEAEQKNSDWDPETPMAQHTSGPET